MPCCVKMEVKDGLKIHFNQSVLRQLAFIVTGNDEMKMLFGTEPHMKSL